LRHTFCLLLGLLMVLPALAADPVYEIEVLAFQRQVDPATNREEDWGASVHKPNLDEGFSLDMIGGLPLGQSDLHLNSAAARLSRQAGYKVILHEAWRQPVGTRTSAPFLHLTGGADLPGADGEALPQLEGLIRLYRDPQLYLQSDLLLRRQLNQPLASPQPLPPLAVTSGVVHVVKPLASPAAVSGPSLGEFPNQDLRRIKEGEIVYIDHPLFGLLVQVRKAG